MFTKLLSAVKRLLFRGKPEVKDHGGPIARYFKRGVDGAWELDLERTDPVALLQPHHAPFTEQLSQQLSIQGVVMSTNHANGNDNTITAVDMSRFRRVMAIAEMGVTTGAGNIQVTFQGSNTSGGTYANTGSTLLLSGNNAGIGTLEIRADQMPAGNRYLQVGLIVNSGPAFCSVFLLGGQSSYSPANQFDAANVSGVQLAGPTRVVN
jgi:hypothetical protein